MKIITFYFLAQNMLKNTTGISLCGSNELVFNFEGKREKGKFYEI
jgi:hypothetical protein